MKANRWAPLAAAVMLVVAAACGDDDDTGGQASTPTSTTTTTAPEAAAPDVGACRGPIDIATIQAATDDRPTVPCDQPHGSETAAVLDLPASLTDATHDEAVAVLQADDDATFDDATTECLAEAGQLWGLVRPTSDQVVRAGQFSSAIYLPSAEAWEAGARWVRCDAVIQPVNQTDVSASTSSFAGVGALPVVPPEFLSCIALDPDGAVPCTEPHVGELVAVIFDFDFDLSELDVTGEGDQEVVAFRMLQTYQPQCEAAVTSVVGAERDDIGVETDVPFEREEAEAEIANYGALRVSCYAITGQPRTGTLAGLGTGPL